MATKPLSSISPKCPKITVLMPVWNGSQHLAESIESILNQTFRDFELLIVDDGSNDTTPEIIKSYAKKDTRIRIITLNHGGIVKALNFGLVAASADWIARMDCDDVAQPERLERQWEAVNKHPGIVLCHTQIEFFGDSDLLCREARMVRSMSLTMLRLCHRCPITHPTVLYLKCAVLTARGYYESERHAEDFGLWGRLIGIGEFISLNKPLLRLRLHQFSVSKHSASEQLELSRKIAEAHCMRFMNLAEADSKRAVNLLQACRQSTTFKEWLWFLFFCLPRLRRWSIEMVLWIATETWTRVATCRLIS